MRKLKCPICERLLNSNAISYHISLKHNIEYEKCNDIKLNLIASKELQKEIIDEYLIQQLCIKDISEKRKILSSEILFILIQNNIKLRNCKEAHHTKQYINNYEKTCLKNYGVANPSQSQEIKERKNQTMLKNYGRINNFQNKEIQQKAEKNIDREKSWESIKYSLFIKYGVNNFGKTPNAIESRKKTWDIKISKMSEDEKIDYYRFLTERMRKNLHGWTSKLEIKIQEILNDLNIEYCNNKYLFGYNYDIIFNNMCILEIQGDFWHANPNKYKKEDILNFPKKKKLVNDIWKYDKKKKDVIEKHGYKIFYIWESELNNMQPIEIINFITNILNYERT